MARSTFIAISLIAVSACSGPTPSATPFQPVTLGFRSTTCDDLAIEFGAIADPSLRSVVDGPDEIAGERKSVLIKKMQVLLVTAVTEQARESGVIGDCALPAWLEDAERGFSDELRQSIGSVAYDGDPVIDYEAWLLELNNDLVAAGLGKG